MIHLFIVNPAAGHRDVSGEIDKALKQLPDITYRLYKTTGPGDATRFVRQYLTENSDPVRIYACGGDGTLHEVANGAAGFSHASVGCLACGSGNDFVKYYGTADDFRDIKSLVEGEAHPIDLIRANDRYAINACHFGFDTAVASRMGYYKRYPFLGGKRAYMAAVLHSLVYSMRSKCSFTCDGKPFHDGDFLLCTMANGSYVGGSYKCAPRSLNDDGLIEVCLALPVSRFRFLGLMNIYKRGEHLDDPSVAPHFRYCRSRKIHLTAPKGFSLTMDGEVLPGTDFTIEAVPQALRFIVPRALAPAASGSAKSA